MEKARKQYNHAMSLKDNRTMKAHLASAYDLTKKSLEEVRAGRRRKDVTWEMMDRLGQVELQVLDLQIQIGKKEADIAEAEREKTIVEVKKGTTSGLFGLDLDDNRLIAIGLLAALVGSVILVPMIRGD